MNGLPHPLPRRLPKAPEVTAEGLQYKAQKWLDDAEIDVADDLSRYGQVEEMHDGDDDHLLLTTIDGKKFRIKITTQVEVKEDG